MSQQSLVEIVNHYQKSIDKSLKDEERLLHCLNKLYKLPISVQHLQDTGIGRTVNALRKYDGEVGVASKALVNKWKHMVAAEESEDGDQSRLNNDSSENNNTEDDDQPNDESHSSPLESYNPALVVIKQEKTDSKDSHTNHSGKHQNSDDERPHEDKEKSRSSSSKHHRSSSKSSHNDHHKSGSRNEETVIKQEKETSHKVVKIENTNHHTTKAPADETTDRHHHSSSRGHKSGGSHKSSDSSSNNSKRSTSPTHNGEIKVKKEKSDCDYSDSNNTLLLNNNDAIDCKRSDKYDKNSNYTNKEIKVEKTDKDRNHKEIKEEKTKSSSTSSHHRHHSSDRSEHSKSKSSHSSSSKKPSDNDEKKSDKHSKHRDRNGDEKKTEKHEKNRERDTKDTRIKEERSDKDRTHFSSSSSSSKRKAEDSTPEKEKPSSNSVSKKTKNVKFEEPEEESKNYDSDGMEIDQSEGFGFAEALGMLDMPSSSKKSGSKKIMSNPPAPIFLKPAKVEKKVKMDTKSLTSTPQLLSGKIKLEQAPDPDIMSALPMMSSISPHYRPMPLNPLVMDCVYNNNGSTKPMKRQMTDDEALGASTSSRNHRTKIYSGVKSTAPAQVPSLMELCYRVIQDNIDLIEYTGGVPYYILKSILQKASANQLERLEHYNPYLMEESDELWEVHVGRRFKGRKREEMESWREMYMRCVDEQQARLEKLTKKVKHHQKIATPVKTTKMAYVDSAVKPPRNVASKQRQFGTERAKVVSPAARVSCAMNGIGTNVAKAGDVRLKVPMGMRGDTAQATVHNKARKAPLMAKTLAALKAGRLFKR